jgi:hypothetical protein
MSLDLEAKWSKRYGTSTDDIGVKIISNPVSDNLAIMSAVIVSGT